jgi:hypothetical protein
MSSSDGMSSSDDGSSANGIVSKSTSLVKTASEDNCTHFWTSVRIHMVEGMWQTHLEFWSWPVDELCGQSHNGMAFCCCRHFVKGSILLTEDDLAVSVRPKL